MLMLRRERIEEWEAFQSYDKNCVLIDEAGSISILNEIMVVLEKVPQQKVSFLQLEMLRLLYLAPYQTPES